MSPSDKPISQCSQGTHGRRRTLRARPSLRLPDGVEKLARANLQRRAMSRMLHTPVRVRVQISAMWLRDTRAHVLGVDVTAVGGLPLLVVKVRDVIATLEADGWRLVRTKGSHRQFRHPTKPGTVTVAGKASIDVPTGTLASIWKQAGLKRP